MKKTIVFLVLFLLLIVAIITPVLAAPAQKTDFTATQTPTGNHPGTDYVQIITNGGTVHESDIVGSGMIKIWTTNPTTSVPNYSGLTSSIISLNINGKTGEGEIKFEMTWTLNGGTFSGNIIGKLSGPEGPQPSYAYAMTLHGVLQGTGAFDGQTAIFDGTKAASTVAIPPTPFHWTGTIVTP